MARQIKKAVKQALKGKIAITGPSGSGKTFSSLIAAGVLGERVAVIDTESGSASLYADRFSFDVIEWEPPYDPRELIETVRELAKEYDTIIVDSLSHFWQGQGGTLDIVDQAGKKTGNSYTAWKEGTPIQDQLYLVLRQVPAHIIVDMRSKQEYVQEKDERGKTQIKKMGLAPVQRAGAEYEFDLVIDFDHDHNGIVSKSRCDALADTVIRPGRKNVEDAFATFKDWLESGVDPEQVKAELADELEKLFGELEDLDLDGVGKRQKVLDGTGVKDLTKVDEKLLRSTIARCKTLIAEAPAAAEKPAGDEFSDALAESDDKAVA